MMTMTEAPQKSDKKFEGGPGLGGGPPYSPHVSQREKLFCKTPFFRQRLRNLSAENTKQTVFSEVNEMKKNFTPKLFGLALTTALTLTTLTACGGGTGTAAAPGGVSSPTPRSRRPPTAAWAPCC